TILKLSQVSCAISACFWYFVCGFMAVLNHMGASGEYIFDHPLCAECGLCCLPWQHKPGAPAFYPCGHLTEKGCELSADERPEACREFTCKRLRAHVSGAEFDLPMGRDEEWLLALFESYLLAGKAEVPEWYVETLEQNRARRIARRKLLQNL
ncbi:hypothetical protein J7K50_09000, partial [bacterium]|nr:hypothetical protein [bacterium]